MTIDRERSAALPSPRDALEAALLFALRAAGVEDPVREHHFMWCCEHGKADHGQSEFHPLVDFKWARCFGCFDRGMAEPDEERGDALVEASNHDYERGRNWRFDFAWPGRKLAVEVDGGTYSGGRHTRGAGYERDAEKGNEAAIRGWRVLHVTAAMIEDGRALDFIERALRVG